MGYKSGIIVVIWITLIIIAVIVAIKKKLKN